MSGFFKAYVQDLLLTLESCETFQGAGLYMLVLLKKNCCGNSGASGCGLLMSIRHYVVNTLVYNVILCPWSKAKKRILL